MTLLEQVEQFLYTHPVQHHKKQLLELIRDAEERYLRRIAELEQDAAVAAMNHAADRLEDSQNQAYDHGGDPCTCHTLPEGTACGWCASQPVYLCQDASVSDDGRW